MPEEIDYKQDYWSLRWEYDTLRRENSFLKDVNKNLISVIEKISALSKDDLEVAFKSLAENTLDQNRLLGIADSVHTKINTTSKFN